LGDDKDGVAALHVLLQLARRLQARGEGFAQQLARLAREHGLFCARQVTVSAVGPDGALRMGRILNALRARSLDEWLPPGWSREDYLARAEQADLLVLLAPRGARICVRPSGTEPKLKFYLEASEPVTEAESLHAARMRAEATLDELAARVRAFTDAL
jgi:phosphomannomutase